MSRIISASEVKKHQGPKSTWIIIHNNVYDVTDYVEEHPGGVEAIMEVAGGDGTQGFEDVAHSDDAREVLAQFKIGTLPPKERTSIPVGNLKWALMALAGALIVGIVLKKYYLT